MFGGAGRRLLFAPALLAAAITMTSCATDESVTAVPEFPAQVRAIAGAAAPPVDDGVIPDDCQRILPPADLGAVLGLPLDTVQVKTTIGVPSPSVGRIERATCAYTSTGGDGRAGGPLLDVNASVYEDPASATKQWRTNAGVEDGTHRGVALGAAKGELIERGGESLLMVVYDTTNLTLILPSRQLPPNRSTEDVLVDLALRVLPTMSSVPPPPLPTTPLPT